MKHHINIPLVNIPQGITAYTTSGPEPTTPTPKPTKPPGMFLDLIV